MLKRLLFFFFIFVSCSISLQAQKIFKGKVLGENNVPLEGVTISLKNSQKNTSTDSKGDFSISVPAGNKGVVTVSFVGYAKLDVTLKDGLVNIINLKTTNAGLDDVVVIGYGTSKKKDLTGAVEKVSMADLSKAPVRSFEEALGGRVAGVQVVSSDGQPGAPTSIVIRGNNSITQDNSPLYIVDGFPVENPNNNSINISDIESIEVLKDASSTAIYGSRGANGVIIITTKKGKVGSAQISYNSYIGSTSVLKKVELLSPYEFVKFQFEYDSINTKSTYLTNGKTIEDYRYAQGIDWQDKILRSARMMNHELAIRGGNASTKYSISGSALQQDGIIRFSGFNRYQGRVRLDQAVNDKIKVGLNVNYSALKSYGTVPSSLTNSSSQTSNLMFSVWGYRPVTGNEADLLNGVDPLFELNLNDSRFNPLETVTYELRNRFTNSANANFNLDYQITKQLLFKSTVGYVSDANRNEEFNGKNTRAGSPSTSAGRINGVNGSIIYNTQNRFVNENTLFYVRKINNHSFDVLGGITYQANTQSIYGAAATLLPNEQLGLSGLDEGKPSQINSLRSINKLASFLGRVNYNFNSKYLATFSYRADGSSKFSRSNHWGYFPSGSLAWRFSKEGFFKKIKLLSDAKIRLSYGLTGNNRVSDFAYKSSLVSLVTLAYPFNGNASSTVVPDQLGNPNLKWETTSQTNLGLDLSVFDSRISFTIDIYRKVTSDLLLNAQLPPSTGFTRAFKNIGQVENKGLEITVNTKNFETKNFKWTTGFNISFNRNKVLSLNDGQESLLSLINWDNQWRGIPGYMAKVGQPLGLYYGAIWDGVYTYDDFDKTGGNVYTIKSTVTSNTTVADPRIQPGHIKYKDLNGDRVINDNDYTIIGDGNPDFIGGFTNNIKYGNFDLNLFFQFSYGNEILNANRLVFEGNSGRLFQNQFASVLNRWTPENTSATLFTARGDGDRIYSSRVIEDGSYLRLKTFQLGYDLPSTLSKKMKINSLRFYLSVQNLITWTKYTGVDPEVSVYNSALTPGFDYSVYPRGKTVTFGLNLNF